MAEIQLSPGLDTREDAEKIARALWAEAVRRGWESEYRDIIRNTEGGGNIPSVGHMSCALAVTRNVSELEPSARDLIAPLLPENATPAISIVFDHRIETSGEDDNCCCPEPDDTDPHHIRNQIAGHARGITEGAGKWLPVRFAPVSQGAPEHEATCSATNCRNA